jgi:hypothetical protein
VKQGIEWVLWMPIAVLVGSFILAACEVDRSHLTEVEGDTITVIVPGDTACVDTTIFQDTLPPFQDTLAVYQDTLPAHQDTLPAYQDTLPAHQDTLPAHQDTLPAVQDTLPAYQDTTFITVEVVDTLAFLNGLCTKRRGNSNNWVCEFPPN